MKAFSQTQICPVGKGKSLRHLFSPGLLRLISEVGLNFFRFLRSTGFGGEEDLVLLSPKDAYSYDEAELGRARVLVNLKKLNRIRHPDLFLRSLVFLLPEGTSFIGCFSDRSGSGSDHTFILDLYRFLRRISGSGRGRDHRFSRGDVIELLEKNGFLPVNMKEMNGLTYFVSRASGLVA
jgi:hypothetical protein